MAHVRLGLVVFLSVLLLGYSPALATKTFLDFQTTTTGNPSPDNWNAYNASDVLDGLSLPLLDELNIPTGISFRFDIGSAFWVSSGNSPIYASYAPSGIDLSELDDDISIQTVGQRMEFTGLTPGQAYDFWLLGWTYEASFREPMDFSVTGAGSWTAIDNPGDARLAINGQYGSPSRTFESYAVNFTADNSGELALEATGGQFFGVHGVVLEPAAPPVNDSVTIFPTLDASAVWNGTTYDVSDGSYSINAQYIDFADHDARAIMEFPLGAVPDDAIIAEATLTIDVSSFTSSTTFPRLTLLGYVANGLLDISDATAGSIDNLIVTTDPIQSLGELTFELDTAYIQSLIGHEDYLGMLGVGGDNGKSVSWRTLESGIFGDLPAQLNLTFAQSLPGDLNGDGFVGIADLGIVLGAWNANVSPGDLLLGDPSGDGFVGIDDLNLVLGHWNTGVPPTTDEVGAIPEPACGLLFGALFLTGLLRRGRAV